MNTLPAMWSILTRKERQLFVALIAVNVLGTASEVLGIFSVLPFLALAGDPSLCLSQEPFKTVFQFCGFKSELSFVVAAGMTTIVAIVLSNVINMGSLLFRTAFCNSVLSEMTGRLFRGFLSRPYPFFLTRNTAVLGKELLHETQNFFTYALEPITIMIARGLQVAAVGIALVVFDWRTALLAAGLFAAFYGAAYVLLMQRLHRHGATRFATNERRFKLVAEALAGIKEVQLFGRHSWYAQAFDEDSRIMSKATYWLTLISMSPRFIIEVLIFTALVASVLLKVAQGQSFNELVPVLGVFAIAGLRMLPSVQLLFQNAALITSSHIAITRMQGLFRDVDALQSAPPLPAPSSARLPLRERLAVRGVTFRYNPMGRAVLENVSLDVPLGSCVGICGPSGSGKTTLMDIFLGLLRPDSGELCVDGRALPTADTPAWQRTIGYVPQSIYLIDGTLAENIAFTINRGAIDMAAVVRAATLAQLHSFIESTELGYETQTGERGVRLSGGQRQRVAIARALYRDPDVLFFDEATSALDSESESLVVEAVQSLAHTKTIIIIAHRLTTLRYCDTIHELRKGRIVRSGAYEDFSQPAFPAH